MTTVATRIQGPAEVVDRVEITVNGRKMSIADWVLAVEGRFAKLGVDLTNEEWDAILHGPKTREQL